VSENALGCFVPLAAKDFITVNAETVEKILSFSRSFLDANAGTQL
jgi:hypothetical protein